MPVFQYKALTAKGDNTTGVIDADTPKEAREKLRARSIYVTGVSNGGGMAARAACELADRLAAAAPVAGGYGTLPACRPSRPLPVLEVHGTGDGVVPYAGKGPRRSGSVAGWLGMWRWRWSVQDSPS